MSYSREISLLCFETSNESERTLLPISTSMEFFRSVVVVDMAAVEVASWPRRMRAGNRDSARRVSKVVDSSWFEEDDDILFGC